MKVLSRALLLACVGLLLVAAPVAAGAKVTTVSSTCRADPIDGFTYCTDSDVEVQTTQLDDGQTRIKIVSHTHQTVADAAGNLLITYDILVREQDVFMETANGPVYESIHVRGQTQTTQGETVSCLRWRTVFSDGVYHVEEASTTPGVC